MTDPAGNPAEGGSMPDAPDNRPAAYEAPVPALGKAKVVFAPATLVMNLRPPDFPTLTGGAAA